MIPGLKNQGLSTANILMGVAVAIKHLRLMTLLMCLSLTAGLVYYVYARPVYMARSLVRFQMVDRPVDAEKIYRDMSERDLFNRLTSPHLMQRTAERLGIVATAKDIRTKYVSQVRASFNSERNIEIEVYAFTPELAKIWAATLVQEFVRDRDEKRAKVRESIIGAYTEEIKDINQRLDEAMRSRYQFANESQMAEIAVKFEWLKRVPLEMADTARRIASMERVQENLKNFALDVPAKLALLRSVRNISSIKTGDTVAGLESSTSGQLNRNAMSTVVIVPEMTREDGDQAFEELDREREKLRQAQRDAEKKYLPAHPKMMEITRKLEAVEKELNAHLVTAQNRFQLEYETLLAKKKELNAKLPEYQQAVVEYERYMESRKMTEAGRVGYSSMYADMEKKMGLLDFAGDKISMHFQYVGFLELRDEVPVSPNRAKIFLLSLIMGVVLAIGVPFLIEFLDHTVTSVEQVEFSHQLRALGIVPLLNAEQVAANAASATTPGIHPDRQVIENFRVIRTGLLSAGAVTKDPQTLVVASAMPEEGKTLVSYNLARSFAQMGEKTLLIDADLRRGRLHRMMGQRSGPGLSNILAQKADWHTVVRPTSLDTLSVITCGKHVEGSTELFASSNFSELMAELRKHYRRIIVDTPPILGLSETAMIQPLVDGVLLVIWSGRTSTQYVKSSVQILQANRANIYGFVLNRLDLSVTSNYYNYYNYYYYSYHYYKSYKSAENQIAGTPSAPAKEVKTS